MDIYEVWVNDECVYSSENYWEASDIQDQYLEENDNVILKTIQE